jgi:hypothetical protein
MPAVIGQHYQEETLVESQDVLPGELSHGDRQRDADKSLRLPWWKRPSPLWSALPITLNVK